MRKDFIVLTLFKIFSLVLLRIRPSRDLYLVKKLLYCNFHATTNDGPTSNNALVKL